MFPLGFYSSQVKQDCETTFNMFLNLLSHLFPCNLPHCLSRSEDSNKRPPGIPGTPGSRDLEAALRRLSLRRDNYLSEKRFFEEERERKLAYLAKEDEKGGGGSSGGGPGTPTESLLSLCSHPSLGSIWSGYSFTARSYLPDKLQIVKPLEGEFSFQIRYLTHNENRSQSIQEASQNENEIYQKQNLNQPSQKQDYNQIFQNAHQNQNQVFQNQQQNQSQTFLNRRQSKIFLTSLRDPHTLNGSSRLLVLSSLPSSQPHIGAPLALVTGLLEVLEQQDSSLNLQHSFYFRHTQPRCWFEI